LVLCFLPDIAMESRVYRHRLQQNRQNEAGKFVISGFLRSVNDIFILIGCLAE
jgi:hypothetical protein